MTPNPIQVEEGITRVPVYREVDIVVVGATTGAVVAACEAAGRGRRVLLISDLPYLGEESAGALRLWPDGIDQNDPIVAKMFESDGSAPVRPAQIKLALDSAVLGAGVGLLCFARPVAVLRDERSRIAGLVLASRTSLLAVRASVVVDATRNGLVIALAGVQSHPRGLQACQAEWTVLARTQPDFWDGPTKEVQPPLRQKLKDGEGVYRAFQLGLTLSTDASQVMAIEHRVRARLTTANVLVAADIVPTPWLWQLAPSTEPLKQKATQLSDNELIASDKLLHIGGLLPLDSEGLASLDRPDTQAALGRRTGRLAAEMVTPSVSGHPSAVSCAGTPMKGLQFAPALTRQANSFIAVPDRWILQDFGEFDVVVVGGGTGGAPAGIAAAREGARTLVIEPQHMLGGVGTAGLISSYWFGNKVGFTAELNEAVMAIDAETRAKRGTGWGPELKSAIYARKLLEAGGTAWFGSFAFGVQMEGNCVAGVLVSTPFGSGLVRVKRVIDATGNADIAAAAGAPCRLIDHRHVATQGTGLSPRVHPEVKYQNSDHTFIDETDPEGITHAFLHARAKYPNDFDTASFVDSRERRQIVGELEVSPLDIMAGRRFPDTVVTAYSNFDTHGFIVHPLFMLAPPDHKPVYANVPYRCMLPLNVDGVLVTGLGMSAHRDALPVIRMQADVQNQGFAAGIAAARSITANASLRNLDIVELQKRLVQYGNIDVSLVAASDSFPLAENAIADAANGDLSAVMNVAILLAHPEQSRPHLLRALDSSDEDRRIGAAVLLGMMRRAESVPVLAKAVRSVQWDEGWNYRGMGQFGASMSRVDAWVIALARARSDQSVEPIVQKARSLSERSEFSHCRAIALAAVELRHPDLAEAIAELLRKPGMTGHAHLDTASVIRTADPSPVETESRNVSLRELYLARGLFACGDPTNLGRTILESYAKDLRGHFARHAQAVLAHGPNAELTGEDIG